MEKLEGYKKIDALRNQIDVDIAYPLSIIQGSQTGEIYVDNKDNPSVALLWHYCGFANIIGDCNKEHMDEIIEMMHHPTEGHSGRMVLQIGADANHQKLK